MRDVSGGHHPCQPPAQVLPAGLDQGKQLGRMPLVQGPQLQVRPQGQGAQGGVAAPAREQGRLSCGSRSMEGPGQAPPGGAALQRSTSDLMTAAVEAQCTERLGLLQSPCQRGLVRSKAELRAFKNVPVACTACPKLQLQMLWCSRLCRIARRTPGL